MKSIVFDSGPIISLTLNNILWTLESLHEKFDGEFYITKEVYNEIITKPLATKKYKFEALQILPLITKGILKFTTEKEIEDKAKILLKLANEVFMARENYIKIVHMGEMQAIACALIKKSDTIAIDERTTRILIEKPLSLKRHFEKKLHTKVDMNEDNLKILTKEFGHLKVIRSFELVTIAFELGLLNIFAQKEEEKLVPNIRSALLESVLWGVKLNGCSVKREEIYEVVDELT